MSFFIPYNYQYETDKGIMFIYTLPLVNKIETFYKDLNKNKLIELKHLAKALEMKNYSKFNKKELMQILEYKIKFETKEETEQRKKRMERGCDI
jgi:hypothetical protein